MIGFLFVAGCAGPGGSEKAGATETGAETAGAETADSGASTDTAPEEEVLGAEVLPWPACELGATDGRLDLDRGCADEVCLGQTLEQADEAYGTPGFCLSFTEGYAYCFYGDGILVRFLDGDGDGSPDEGTRASLVEVLDPWDGGTEDGLSLSISVACWVETLGPADLVSLTLAEDGYNATSLYWDDYYLYVADLQDASLAFVPDGLVESATFVNALYDL